LRSLVDRIEELLRGIGRLEAGRDQVTLERDALRAGSGGDIDQAGQEMPQERAVGIESGDQPQVALVDLLDRLRRLFGR
jgi:hypothetical protein